MNGGELPPDDQTLAAELALGLLDEADRRAAEARAAHDPVFAAAVAWWQAQAAALIGPGEPPRPSLWGEIAARLPANDDAPSPALSAPHPRRRDWGWPAATAIATAAAAVLAAITLRPPPPPPHPHPRLGLHPATLVAVLRAPSGRAVLAVGVDRDRREVTLAPAGLTVGAQAVELWVIPAGGKPAALGLVDPLTPGRLDTSAPVLPLLRPGATLAVSLEPRGGSPTGQPTGPVILTGVIAVA